MILRLSFLSLIFFNSLGAITVLVTKDAIKLDEKITISKLEEKEYENVPRTCTPMTKKEIEEGEYIATHYINKNSVLCLRSVKLFEDYSIVFNFGGVKIEKKGTIIYENDEFIRFKNLDGQVEQIYKDGRLR
ncbi:MAG: hypothetical protein PHY49_00235 [Aliarcobacter skirrowii]|nr:hypothetical protein [Aliarcobacter skirrowii]